MPRPPHLFARDDGPPDVDPLEDYRDYLNSITRLSYIFSSALAATFAFAAILTYIIIRSQRKRMSNRISLRLALAVCVADLGYELSNVISGWVADQPYSLEVMRGCAVAAYSVIFFNLLSIFLSAVIALNLLLVFVYKQRSVHHSRSLEIVYYIVPILLAAALPAIPFSQNRIGKTGEGDCWYRLTSSKESMVVPFVWSWITYYGWIGVTLIFNFIAVFLVWRSITSSKRAILQEEQKAAAHKKKLLLDPTAVASREFEEYGSGSKRVLLLQAVTRIGCYAIVPLVSTPPSVIIDSYITYVKTGIENTWGLYVLVNIFIGLHAIINSVVFFLDPYIASAREEWRCKIVSKFVYGVDLSSVQAEQMAVLCERLRGFKSAAGGAFASDVASTLSPDRSEAVLMGLSGEKLVRSSDGSEFKIRRTAVPKWMWVVLGRPEDVRLLVKVGALRILTPSKGKPAADWKPLGAATASAPGESLVMPEGKRFGKKKSKEEQFDADLEELKRVAAKKTIASSGYDSFVEGSYGGDASTTTAVGSTDNGGSASRSYFDDEEDEEASVIHRSASARGKLEDPKMYGLSFATTLEEEVKEGSGGGTGLYVIGAGWRRGVGGEEAASMSESSVGTDEEEEGFWML
ncbi:hypothetical protein BJ742DRAFT_810753 [Cladochytrium replicatum]|nr:hypothetical protein BJ742DRAFT_810753 [Cladochytrium replicatum]